MVLYILNHLIEIRLRTSLLGNSHILIRINRFVDVSYKAREHVSAIQELQRVKSPRPKEVRCSDVLMVFFGGAIGLFPWQAGNP